MDMKEILVFDAALMGKFDRKAEERYGIPSLILMENAGGWVAKKVMEMEEVFVVTVVAGPGNNGGDGIVAARHLQNHGLSVNLLLLTNPEKLRGDAKRNFEIAQRSALNIFVVESEKQWDELLPFVERADLVIDAIFGTGLKREVKGLFARAIDDINLLAPKILSVDLPSGVSSEDGSVMGTAVEADFTVTFEALKFGHIFPPGEGHCGDIEVVKIGIPEDAYEDEELPYRLTYPEGLFPAKLLRRKPDSHKGDYGHVLVVAGSRGKTGAAALASFAALKAGAGLVTLAAPEDVLPMIPLPPEVMTFPLPSEEGRISRRAISLIDEILKGKSVLAAGPGLGTWEETGDFLLTLLEKAKIPKVLDADALNIIASQGGKIPGEALTVLTPHPGEFSRLTSSAKEENPRKRTEAARNFAREKGVYLVLKGYRTVIATPDGTAYINSTGNPGMATGGSGDVLTGIIAAFLAQAEEDEVEEAVVEAVGFHGLAGDLAASELSQPYITAGDLIEYLSEAFKNG